MKIICIGRNYPKHIKELDSAMPEELVVFVKPDNAVIKKGKPFYLPNSMGSIHYEAELVFKINNAGKSISEKNAWQYISEVTVGIDFTARELQSKLKEKGLPWERAKAWDFSAYIGDFHPIENFINKDKIGFSLLRNER